jgi:hypothetical protein
MIRNQTDDGRLGLDILMVNAKISEHNIIDSWTKLKISRIVKLDLSFNYFTRLYKEKGNKVVCFFDGFTLLEELNLSNNPIELIHPTNFSSTPNLRVLLMENTSISKEMNLRFIKNLKRLETLSFKGHKIHSMTSAHFAKMFVKATAVHMKALDIRSMSSLNQLLAQKEKEAVLKVFVNLESFNGKALHASQNNSPNIYYQCKGSPRTLKIKSEFSNRNSEAKVHELKALNDKKEPEVVSLDKSKGGITSSFGEFMIRSSSLKNLETPEEPLNGYLFINEEEHSDSNSESIDRLEFTPFNVQGSPSKQQHHQYQESAHKETLFTFKKPEVKSLSLNFANGLMKNLHLPSSFR